MTLQKAITARHSVRKYIDKDIMRVLVLIVLFMPPIVFVCANAEWKSC